MIKTIIEPVLGFFFLLLCTPLLISIAVVIKLDSAGPILAPKQTRLGKDSKKFIMYKFRTLKNGTENQNDDDKFKENMFKETPDRRSTKIGRKLRFHDLDELPQLINVIKGDMSFIGPRAFLPHEERHYKKKYPELRQLINFRKKAKPGITGLWQISGRNSTSLKDRLNYDKKYITETSLLLDLKITFQTIQKLISKEWA